MPNYKYKAMNGNGERLEGNYEAKSKEGVMEMISLNNYYPLLVEEVQEGIHFDLSFLEKVKSKDISIFCRQFYTMLNAGAPINTCLEVLSQQMTSKKLKEALSKVHDEVRKGATLSEAMRAQQKIFPDLLVSMVASGELTGNLDTIMLRMCSHYEKENKINHKITGAMIYPAIIATIAVLAGGIILTFVMPIFVNMFASSGVVLPTSTKIMLAMSSGLTNNLGLIILIIVLSIFGIRSFLKSDGGIMLSHKLRLKIPILKGLNEKIIVSRFTRTLSTVLFSGVSLVEGLTIVSEVVGNRIVEEKLLKARDEVIKGNGLADSLRETKVFPPMLISMISIGEESGSLDDILSKTADFYDEELDSQIQTFTSLLEPLMIVIMGVLIGVMMLSIVQPMFGMYSTVN
ncbi:type II secretion system F family protein [Clostridium estertheticum]|uniref:type II secretion system F family protein n=1 Tax=Clostridium estertheticum TaxID=238834 RepID=UPI001C0C18D0|nr:type II secretion system F family protein [Clostridium estertheticum]MBU3198431.1 type II secretion system F family protein [Clostridium estertheticum]WAG65111.1 type II secretion system F family protein [Clostridium estertheticum]